MRRLEPQGHSTSPPPTQRQRDETMLWYSCSAPRIDREDLHRELSQLSTEEKEQVRNDIEGRKLRNDHGPRENQRARQKLKELSILLQNPWPVAPDAQHRRPLRNENGGASFALAQKNCPLYVNSDAFRLMILRSSNYNVEVRSDCCCFQKHGPIIRSLLLLLLLLSLSLFLSLFSLSNQPGECCNTGRTS